MALAVFVALVLAVTMFHVSVTRAPLAFVWATFAGGAIFCYLMVLQLAATSMRGAQFLSAPTNPWGMPDDQNGYVDFDLDQAKAELEDVQEGHRRRRADASPSRACPASTTSRCCSCCRASGRTPASRSTSRRSSRRPTSPRSSTGDYQAAFFRNYGYADPDSNFSFWSSTDGQGRRQPQHQLHPVHDARRSTRTLTTGRQSGYADVRKQAYDDLAQQLNAGLTNIWLYRTPYSLIADQQVKGLAKAQESASATSSPRPGGAISGAARADHGARKEATRPRIDCSIRGVAPPSITARPVTAGPSPGLSSS